MPLTPQEQQELAQLEALEAQGKLEAPVPKQDSLWDLLKGSATSLAKGAGAIMPKEHARPMGPQMQQWGIPEKQARAEAAQQQFEQNNPVLSKVAEYTPAALSAAQLGSSLVKWGLQGGAALLQKVGSRLPSSTTNEAALAVTKAGAWGPLERQASKLGIKMGEIEKPLQETFDVAGKVGARPSPIQTADILKEEAKKLVNPQSGEVLPNQKELYDDLMMRVNRILEKNPNIPAEEMNIVRDLQSGARKGAFGDVKAAASAKADVLEAAARRQALSDSLSQAQPRFGEQFEAAMRAKQPLAQANKAIQSAIKKESRKIPSLNPISAAKGLLNSPTGATLGAQAAYQVSRPFETAASVLPAIPGQVGMARKAGDALQQFLQPQSQQLTPEEESELQKLEELERQGKL